MFKSTKYLYLFIALFFLSEINACAQTKTLQPSEIEFLSNFLKLIQNGDYESVKKLQTNEHRIFIQSDYFYQVSDILKKTNLDTIKLHKVTDTKENGENVRYVGVYFEDDKYLELLFKLEILPTGYRVRTMSMDSYWESKNSYKKTITRAEKTSQLN